MTTLEDISLTDPVATLLYQRTQLLLPPAPEFNNKTIVKLTVRMMQIIQELANDRSGAYRKTIVILVLKRIIDNHQIIDIDTKTSLIALIDTTISCMIDELIHVWNRQTTFLPRSRCNCIVKLCRNCTWGRAFSFDRL